MSAILTLLQKHGIAFKKTGSSYVCRCPVCKKDNKVDEHNAIINIDTNTIYCFSEGKLYTYTEIAKELGESFSPEWTRKRTRISAGVLSGNVKLHREKRFEDVKKSLEKEGYIHVATYEYYDNNFILRYRKHRFERQNATGDIEKVIIPEEDGLAALKTRQIPYRMEQISYLDYKQVWIAEGEKCTDELISLLPDSNEEIAVFGYVKPKDFEGFEFLVQDKDVVIFQDNDRTGEKNSKDLVEKLKKTAKRIKVVGFKDRREGYDVYDFIQETGGSFEELLRYTEQFDWVYKDPADMFNRGLIKIDTGEEEFVLEPFLPKNSIIIFDGLGESGKSFIAMQMAISVATGSAFMTGLRPSKTGRVIYMTAEDTERQFVKRMTLLAKGMKVKTDLLEKNFFWISVLSEKFSCSTYRLLESSGGGIKKTEFYVFLESAISRIKPEFVVLDSLVNFYGLEENSSKEASVFMETLKLLGKTYGCSFLLLHHQTKEAMRKDGEKQFRGSMVFREQARCRFFIEKDRKDEKLKWLRIEKLNVYSEKQREYAVRLVDTMAEDGSMAKVWDRDLKAEVYSEPPQESKSRGKEKDGAVDF